MKRIFNDFPSCIAFDEQLFHSALDRYLRAAVESIAKDFGLEASEWFLLNDTFIERNGGLQKNELVHFRRFFVNYDEDTLFLLDAFTVNRKLFENREKEPLERVFRHNFQLWKEAMQMLASKKQDCF